MKCEVCGAKAIKLLSANKLCKECYRLHTFCVSFYLSFKDISKLEALKKYLHKQIFKDSSYYDDAPLLSIDEFINARDKLLHNIDIELANEKEDRARKNQIEAQQATRLFKND